MNKFTALLREIEIVSELYHQTPPEQFTSLEIELDAINASLERSVNNQALRLTCELRITQAKHKLSELVIDELAYYALPEEQVGQNEPAFVRPDISAIAMRYYECIDSSVETIKTKDRLAKMLGIVVNDVE